MTTVIVPPRAGVLSAVGILCADLQVDLVESMSDPLDHDDIDARLDELTQRAAAALASVAGEVSVERALDCRYAGQSHELRVPSIDEFPAEHERRNGYRRDGHPIEVVALRATARVASGLSIDALAPVERAAVVGPAVLAEPDCTIWVPAGWAAEPHPTGALLLRRGAARP
jgi:N-methylhydantoinase A/oxoprolinase/acetone carboxylase beta subunit